MPSSCCAVTAGYSVHVYMPVVISCSFLLGVAIPQLYLDVNITVSISGDNLRLQTQTIIMVKVTVEANYKCF